MHPAPTPPTVAARRGRSTTLAACAGLCVLLALCACGGGADEHHVPTPGIDCQAKPEACA